MYKPFVSIIIICEEWNKFLEESLPHYDKLDYDNLEVFVFSTSPIKKNFPKIKFVSNPKLKNKPAEKRDMAMKYANGEIFAFIDDDAFPKKDWLKNAVHHFKDKNVAGVGGPGINPPNSSILEQTSGWIRSSPVGGFGTNHCYIPTKQKYIDDHPSMNLLIRAADFKEIGGFDSNYYPGEDTKLCLDLTKKLEKNIIYDPKVIVYHHKRPLFKKHLIQNGRYGLHRGHFARILPETSRRWFFFLPSLFTIGFSGGLVILLMSRVLPTNLINTLASLYLMIMGIYTSTLILNAIWILLKSKNIAISILSIPGILATHLWYGIRFIQGFLSPHLLDNYGRSE